MRILPHFSFDTRGPWDWKLLLCIESSLQLQQNKTKQKVDCWVSYITLTRNLKNVCTLIFIIYNPIVPVVSGQSISFSSSIRLVRQGIGVRTVTVTGSAFGSTILDYFLTAELPNDCFHDTSVSALLKQAVWDQIAHRIKLSAQRCHKKPVFARYILLIV